MNKVIDRIYCDFIELSELMEPRDALHAAVKMHLADLIDAWRDSWRR